MLGNKELNLKKEGIEEKDFSEKLWFLCDKWRGAHVAFGDCNGTRLVAKVFEFEVNNPLTIAIIVNNINHLKKLEKKHPIDDSVFFWFAFACICGADEIVKYFIQEPKYNEICMKRLGDFESVIYYALASRNPELAIYIAKLAIKAGQRDQGPIHFFGGKENRSLMEGIDQRFTKAKQQDQSPTNHL